MDAVSGPNDQPDDRDLDEGGLDLTPRDLEATAARRSGRRRWGPLVVLGALGIVIVLILMQAGDASMYFKNADEAVAEIVAWIASRSNESPTAHA